MKASTKTEDYLTPSTTALDLSPEGLLCQSLEDVLNEGYEYNNFGEW